MRKLVLAGALAAMTFTTFAAERFPIRFGGEQMRGQTTIKLKQELNRNYRINLDRYNIEKVVLVAKSKQGRGTAFLRVGPNTTYEQIIEGSPYDFHSEDQYSYSRMVFQSPSRFTEGPWQLNLRGNIKVRRVVVFLEEKRRGGGGRWDDRPGRGNGGGHGRLNFTSAGEQRFDKFLTDIESYSVHQRQVKALKIIAKSNSVQVEQVRVRYGNGEVEDAYELQGFLSEGASRTMFINSRGRNVQSVTIYGTSGLIGSRGKIELLVGR